MPVKGKGFQQQRYINRTSSNIRVEYSITVLCLTVYFVCM